MYLLGIDTATNSGGVAISRNAELIGLLMVKAPLRYGEHLLSYIDFLLQQLELTLDDIGCCIVSQGPGSFTGLRVGLATAKGLCQSRNLPCVGVPTLEALAHQHNGLGERICALLDARRQQLYAGAYDLEPEESRLVYGPEVGSASEIASKLPEGDWVMVGDGAQLYAGALRAARPDCRVMPTDNFLLPSLCRLGFGRVLAGETESAHHLDALYVRPPDIRLPEQS